MKLGLSFFLGLFLSISCGAVVRTSAGSGNWATGATWVGGIAPTAVDDAIIANGHTVTVAAAATIRNLTINTGGTLTASAALTVSATYTFTMQAGSFYNHNNTGTASTTIFGGIEAFNATSTIQLNNWSGAPAPSPSVITGVSVTGFGNLIMNVNCGAWWWNCEGLGFTVPVNGNLDIRAACTPYLNNTAGNITINIGGNMITASGVCYVKRSATGNVNFTCQNFISTAGIFHFINGGNIAANNGNLTLTVNGSWTHSGGQVLGISNPINGNLGTVNVTITGNLTHTAGSIIWHSTDITDGRTCSITINGNLTLGLGTGSDFMMINNITNFTTNNAIYTLTVGGNFSTSGSSGVFGTRWNSTGADNIYITGNLALSGGTTTWGGGNPNPTNVANNTLTCNIQGNVSITGAAVLYSQSSNNSSTINLTLGTVGAVNWLQTSSGTVSLCNVNINSGKTVTMTGTKLGNIQTGRTLTVLSGANLYMSNYPVQGTGNFVNQSNTLLGIGSAAGILTSGASGNVQVSGTRTYNSDATYLFYEGQTPQSTGNFITTTTNGTYPSQVHFMTINKTLATNVVNLTNTTDIILGGTLTLTSGILTTSATAATAPWIRIPSGSAVSPVGGSANSFVDGYIRRQGSTTFTFPTGDNGAWRRIEVTAPSISTEFEARYINTLYSNTTSMAASPSPLLTHVSLVEYWMLSKPLGADAASCKVKLYWENAGTSGILKFDSLSVARWNGAAWENTNCYGTCPINWTSSQTQRTYSGSATGAGAGTIQSNTVTNFSPFTFSSIGNIILNPLPIELTVFTGAPYMGNSNLLLWETATETNNDYFAVERSSDGISFAAIGIVDGAGTSSQKRKYSFIDESPEENISYYRLKQVDFDLRESFSEIIAIKETESGTTINLFPNPVSGHSDFLVTAGTETGGITKISFLDISGRVIYSEDNLGKIFTWFFNHSKLPGGLVPGTYVVQVETGFRVSNHKLLIQE